MQDKFVNKAYADVVESSANTLTFKEIQTGLAMFEKIAWVVHRIRWYPVIATVLELNAETDYVNFALVGNNKMTSLAIGDQACYDLMTLMCSLTAAGVSSEIVRLPYVADFSNLPGKGLIIPPRPLYVAIQGSGMAAPAQVRVVIEFTHLQMKGDEYWELVEALRIVE